MSEIRALREAAGLTQQRFADLFGIPKRTIEDWEGGRRNPPDYLINLIKFFLEHQQK